MYIYIYLYRSILDTFRGGTIYWDCNHEFERVISDAEKRTSAFRETDASRHDRSTQYHIAVVVEGF